MARVHPTAVVDPRAELDGDVEVGPYCVIGPGARVASGTKLLSHVVIEGDTQIGRGNVVHPFAVVGGAAQTKHDGAHERLTGDARPRRGAVVVGDDNVLREHVTISASTGDRPTTLGSKNLLMAGAHVAHDVVVGSSCVIANAVQLAGHVVVGDWVVFGGLAGVAQRVRVGESAFVAAGAMCERDVPPFVEIVQGDRARVRALNVIGLERRGLPARSIDALRRAFAVIFVRRGVPREVALKDVDRSDVHVDALVRALETTGAPRVSVARVDGDQPGRR